MQRSAAVSSSSELARLAGVLVRWTGASVSEIARAAQVDRGNLSRFLRQAKHSGIGVGRAPAVLSALGWSPLGPSPTHVHKWMLDDRVDLGWVFGTLLSSEVEVSPLLPFESLHDQDEVLEHVGWLIGRRRGTYFLLSQRPDTPSPTGQDLLAELLDPRHRLAKPVEPARVDVHTFHQITEGELTPAGLASALGRPAKPDLRLSVEALRKLEDALSMWLTETEFVNILHDAEIRKSRANPEDMERFAMSALFKDKMSNDQQRQLATTLVRNLSAKKYQLPWPKDPDS